MKSETREIPCLHLMNRIDSLKHVHSFQYTEFLKKERKNSDMARDLSVSNRKMG